MSTELASKRYRVIVGNTYADIYFEKNTNKKFFFSRVKIFRLGKGYNYNSMKSENDDIVLTGITTVEELAQLLIEVERCVKNILNEEN